jgi:hypothetical protein
MTDAPEVLVLHIGNGGKRTRYEVTLGEGEELVKVTRGGPENRKTLWDAATGGGKSELVRTIAAYGKMQRRARNAKQKDPRPCAT